MSDSEDGLVSIYRAPDMAAAAFLVQLLAERDISVFEQAVSIGPLPVAQYGTWGYRLMVRREDLESHGEEITAAIREFEQTLGYPATR
jgi:hypothetical protein